MNTYKNYNEVKGTVSVIKSQMRTDALEILLSTLYEVCGEDVVSIVGNNTVALALGERTLANGSKGELCVEINVKAKDYDQRTTASGNKIEAYNRLETAEIYEIEKSEKEKQAERKAREKVEKIKADERTRAERALRKAQERMAKVEE